jgi:hypothetical protein
LEPKRTLSANLTFGRSERATGGASKSLPARSRLNEAEAMLPPLIAVEKSSGWLSTGEWFNAIKDPLAISRRPSNAAGPNWSKKGSLSKAKVTIAGSSVRSTSNALQNLENGNHS